MSPARLCAALALAARAAAVPFGPSPKLFGSAVKNGPLPPFGTELDVFAHACGVPPCQVTQIHVPSIYASGGCPTDWEHGRLRVYVDNATEPTLDVRLLQLAFVGAQAEYEPQAKSATLFSAGGLFGKNAGSGGVFTTIRVPFGAYVRVTLEQAESCPTAQGTYWIIVRGVEALPLRVGELELPDAARLAVARIDNRTLQEFDFATLAAADASQDGLLFATYFEARSADPNYLEGCFRLFGPDNSTAPLFLSSGTEDYFLSASYFDEGIFAGATAGLTCAAGPTWGARRAPRPLNPPPTKQTRPRSPSAASSRRTRRTTVTLYLFMAGSSSSGATWRARSARRMSCRRGAAAARRRWAP